jgi:hypothetical protein
MSVLTYRPVLRAGIAPQRPRTRGFLHIVRYGAGLRAMYVVTYHRLQRSSSRDPNARHPQPMLAENPQSLIELLERLGVDFRLGEVHGALKDVLRFGSANIPDLWLRDDKIVRNALAEA